MAVTYDWNCKTLEVYTNHTDFNNPSITKSNVVYQISWVLRGVDENNISGSISRITKLPINDLSNFIEQTELTNDIVKNWLFKIIGPDEKTNYENEVLNIINEQINPTKQTIVLEL
jgi:Asp-tRNA(Asn)/Glu-tRNA(Gln) amidotransferase B subunit